MLIHRRFFIWCFLVLVISFTVYQNYYRANGYLISDPVPVYPGKMLPEEFNGDQAVVGGAGGRSSVPSSIEFGIIEKQPAYYLSPKFGRDTLRGGILEHPSGSLLMADHLGRIRVQIEPSQADAWGVLLVNGFSARRVFLEGTPESVQDVEMQKGGRLKITTVSALGHPVPGILIDLSRAHDQIIFGGLHKNVWRGTTDKYGNCSFNYLDSGRWNAKALDGMDFFETPWIAADVFVGRTTQSVAEMEQALPHEFVSFLVANRLSEDGLVIECCFSNTPEKWWAPPVGGDGMFYFFTEKDEALTVDWRIRGREEVARATAMAGDRRVIVLFGD